MVDTRVYNRISTFWPQGKRRCVTVIVPTAVGHFSREQFFMPTMLVVSPSDD